MYTKNGNHLKYFVPNILLAQAAAEVLVATDIGAASADHGELICVKPCRVSRLMFVMTEEVAGGTTTPPQAIFTKRPTPLSATDESVVGTLNIPDGTAVGKVVYKDVEPVAFAIGDSMELSHVIGVGTPTGKGHFAFICEDADEVAANNSDMIASA